MTETTLITRMNNSRILLDGFISLVMLIVCFSIVLDSKPVRRYCNFNPFCRCIRYNNGCYECPASCSSEGNLSSLTNTLEHSTLHFNFNPGLFSAENDTSVANTTEYTHVNFHPSENQSVTGNDTLVSKTTEHPYLNFHPGVNPFITVGVSTTSNPAGAGTSTSTGGGDLVCPVLGNCIPSMIEFDDNDCAICSETGHHLRPIQINNGCPPITVAPMTDCHIDRNGCFECIGSLVSTTTPETTTTPKSTSTTTTPTITTQTTTTPTTITPSKTTPITTPTTTLRFLTLDTSTRARGDTYCLQCDETVSPHTCNRVTKCGNTESCFIDSLVNSMGGIRYRLGCRDTHQCGISGKRELSSNTVNRHTHSAQEMHHRRGTSDLPDDTVADDSGTSVVCSQCCNGSLCNTGGCGTNPYPELRLGTRGPMCFTCSQQSSMDDCDTVRLCGRNQMCKLEQISISDIVLWTTSCEDARACQVLMNGAGKLPGSNCTSTCCASDLCNHECPASCPILHCQLDCGNPPRYKKNINGCAICLCDTTMGTHALIG